MLRFSSPDKAELIWAILPSMPKVRVLNLAVSDAGYFGGPLNGENSDLVIDAEVLIARLPHLERLSYFPDYSAEGGLAETRPSTTQFAPVGLKYLELGYSQFAIEDLKLALLGPAASLSQVGLGSIRLQSGSWIEMFDFIRDNLRLEAFWLAGELWEKDGRWGIYEQESVESSASNTQAIDLLTNYVLRSSSERPFVLPTTADAHQRWVEASDSSMRWTHVGEHLETSGSHE